MRLFQFFASILSCCFATSISALPVLEDEVSERVRHEHSINNSIPDITRNSRVSIEQLQTDTPYIKNHKLRNIKQQEIPSEKVPSQKAPLQEIRLREVLKYYNTLLEPYKGVFSNTASSTNRFNKKLHAGEPIFQLPNFTDVFDELLKPYSIKVETFNTLQNIFGDNTLLSLKKSGEIVNLEAKLIPISIDNYAAANTNMDFVQLDAFAGQYQEPSGENVLSIKKLINKLINIITHPISIMILLVSFLVYTFMMLIRNNRG